MQSFETHARPSHATPTPAEVAAVRDLLAREGLARTQQILGIGRHTVERIRGRLTVHRSTMIAVRVALATLATQQERTP